jgi:hypothetical protein
MELFPTRYEYSKRCVVVNNVNYNVILALTASFSSISAPVSNKWDAASMPPSQEAL